MIRHSSQPEAMPNIGFLASLRALEQCDGDVDRAVERMQSKPVYEVAIIGSGPAGLVSAKTLLEEDISNIVVFEETSCAGGLWNREGGGTKKLDDSAKFEPRIKVPCIIQNEKTGEAAMEIPASVQPVYENLTSNFPKDMTSFLGYPFAPEIENFPKAETVKNYYQNYAKNYDVDKVTKYHTRVVHCSKSAMRALWKIETLNVKTGERQHHLSRRLLVCNGHFRKAFAPYISGMEHFQGRFMHSSAFSSATNIKANETVLIVGGGISGADIAKTILDAGSARVLMSVRNWKVPQDVLLPRLQKNKGMVIRPGVDYIDSDGNVHFYDLPTSTSKKKLAQKYNAISSSVTVRPDVILFATGYRYHFPFFDDTKTFLTSNGFKMENLYKRVLSTSDNSLAFIGITNVNFSPALSMEYQAKWFAIIVVKGNCRSLGPEEIEEEINSRQHDKTQDALALAFPSYCNSLAAEIGARGYWLQLLSYRLPLFIRTTWTRCGASKRRFVLLFGAVGVSFFCIGVSSLSKR
ncbi:MAG: hypothetical protein SGILL_003224 [Bacillariaceae sp.]